MLEIDNPVDRNMVFIYTSENELGTAFDYIHKRHGGKRIYAINDYDKIYPRSLPNVTELNFARKEVTKRQAETLLLAADQIKRLSMRAKHLRASSDVQTEAVKSFKALSKDALPKLVLAELRSTSISANKLKSLFNAAPNLQELDLSNCEASVKLFNDLSAGALPNLKKINLSFTKLSAEELNSLLRAAPNLKEITLNGCQEALNAFLEQSDNALPNLKCLRVSDVTLTPDLIKAIHQVANHLVILDLVACKFNDGGVHYEFHDTRSKARHLNLSAHGFDMVALARLLILDNKIKSLTIKNSDDLDALSLMTKDLFPNLESANFEGSSLSCDQLKALIAASPKLTHIDLGNLVTHLVSKNQLDGLSEEYTHIKINYEASE